MKSVVDRQASAMFDLVRSCRLVFTATITRMFSTMIRGQVRAFTTILTMNTARRSGEMFAGFRGLKKKPQLDEAVLNVVWFIFADSDLSRLLQFVLLKWLISLAFCTLSVQWA